MKTNPDKMLFGKYRAVIYWGKLVFYIVLLICVFVSIDIIAFNHNKRYDLSLEKKYSVSEQSRKIIQGLDNEIKVVVFYRMGDRWIFSNILQQLAGYSGLFHYQLIDLDRNPGKAKAYGIKGYGQGVCEYRGKSNIISYADEEGIINSIIKLTDEKKKIAYFTTGHGEKNINTEYSKIVRELKREGWRTIDFLPMKENRIPCDATVLIVAGPEKDFLGNELEMMSDYVKNGGNIIIMVEPFTELPLLVRFLREYKIKLAEDIIVDKVNKLYGGGYLTSVISIYGNHEITRHLKAATILKTARSVTNIIDSDSVIESYPLAMSSRYSWENFDYNEIKGKNVKFDANVDKHGPVSVAVLAEIKGDEEKSAGKRNGHIVCFGDSDFIEDSYVDVLANKDFFMNTMDWMATEGKLISIRQKNVQYPYNFMENKQAMWIFWFSVIIQPVVFLILGAMLYMYRKRRG